MRRLLLTLTLILFLPALPLRAEPAPEYITGYVENPTLIGKGTLSFLWMDVYDARLWAGGNQWSEEAPFALQLAYQLDLKGEDIADRTMDELAHIGISQENQSAWRDDVFTLFPNVSDGDTLTGIYLPEEGAVFYKNSVEVSRISNPELARAFFRIWLSERTSEPSLRQQLLGRQ